MKELFKNFFTKFMKAEEKKARNIKRQKVRTDNESIFLRSFNLQDKMMDEGEETSVGFIWTYTSNFLSLTQS